ncbi:MAG TPA: DNA polymerase III subunit gamma/tau, partial [Candidatus Polarisedimenticolia bacterium]|nr:DNA polymerase III subunit gamma/tau [Candidatus Polarisedimenticolia bacterium]
MPDAPHYQVLARKYRPRAFDEVVGQAGVVATLRNAITQQRLHHAYLFSGTRGVGKTTLARLFARALNCVEGPTPVPCGDCPPCREIAAGTSLDVIEIDGASNRKVEDVDPLREAARYAPARDRHKIFLIDEVHMLSETAFNALLKILEEPPPRTLFLFATTEPEEVPDTILSRCLHLACRSVGRPEIAAALARVAAAESIQGTPEAFDLIAGLAAGSMRDGLSLLDQVIAFTGGKVEAAAVRESLGLIDRGLVLRFLEAIARREPAGALLVIETLCQAGADLTHFAREALARARDAMVCGAAGPAGAASLGLSEEEAEAGRSLAAALSADGLLRLNQALLDLADRIRRDEHPRYLLETAAL